MREFAAQATPRPRSRTYGLEVERVIVQVWESWTIFVPSGSPQFAQNGPPPGQVWSPGADGEIERHLASISVATVSDCCANIAQLKCLAASRTHRGNQADLWSADETHCLGHQRPGHFEVDLVHHSGESTAGEYGHSLQLIDVATGWSERV